MVAKRNQRKNRIGLSRLEERKIKRALRLTAPSEPWIDSQFTSFDDTDPKGEPIVYRFHSPRGFPPAGMVKCPLCGRTVPPVSMETPRPSLEANNRRDGETPEPRCMDCRPAHIHKAHGASPSAVAIREIQYRNLRLDEIKLEPETTAALRRELEHYYRGQGPSPVVVDFS